MEEVGVTIGYLQDSIKRKDYHPELIKEYFLQRSEEAGEGTCTGNLKRLSSRRVRKGNSRRRIVGLIIMFFLLPTVIDQMCIRDRVHNGHVRRCVGGAPAYGLGNASNAA